MGTPAYNALVKKSGTLTSMTSEAMTSLGGNAYQITNTAKRVWNRDSILNDPGSNGLTFYGNGVEIPAVNITYVDMLHGIVQFSGSQTTPITVTGKYYPLAVVAGGKQYGLNIQQGILEDTDFSSGGVKTRAYGVLTASANIGRWDDLLGAFVTILQGRTPLVLEFAPNNGAESARGWFIPESSANSGDVGSLVEEAINFQLDGESTSVYRKAFSYR